VPFSRSPRLEHSLIQISGATRRSGAESAFTICARVACRGSFLSEEVLNARRLLWSGSLWAVKGGLFSSRKGSDFLADISWKLGREMFRRVRVLFSKEKRIGGAID